jgi:GT2 family glycosyltransferase
VFFEVGGFDENLKVAFNDVDFCLKVRKAGYRNVWTPFAELYHHESLSRGHEDTPERKKRFRSEVAFMKEKWGDVLKSDPFYSPHLTLDREDFSIRKDKRSRSQPIKKSAGKAKTQRANRRPRRARGPRSTS